MEQGSLAATGWFLSLCSPSALHLLSICPPKSSEQCWNSVRQHPGGTCLSLLESVLLGTVTQRSFQLNGLITVLRSQHGKQALPNCVLQFRWTVLFYERRHNYPKRGKFSIDTPLLCCRLPNKALQSVRHGTRSISNTQKNPRHLAWSGGPFSRKPRGVVREKSC